MGTSAPAKLGNERSRVERPWVQKTGGRSDGQLTGALCQPFKPFRKVPGAATPLKCREGIPPRPDPQGEPGGTRGIPGGGAGYALL